ncbi:hypothetical protein ACIA8O_38785 [Kitasatospora sp. NPDC051853]|uniref:hypothetical protein n=1 Tax=Kitasatospora sp. NPDC051853 TaxID=3364058 RepID=UPI00379B940A
MPVPGPGRGGHHPLIQQSTATRPGQWWANCCGGIITRLPLSDDAWCRTREDAEALAAWPEQLALFA